MKLSPTQSRALDDLASHGDLVRALYQSQTWTALERFGLVRMRRRMPVITAKGKSTISRGRPTSLDALDGNRVETERIAACDRRAGALTDGDPPGEIIQV